MIKWNKDRAIPGPRGRGTLPLPEGECTQCGANPYSLIVLGPNPTEKRKLILQCICCNSQFSIGVPQNAS